MKNLLSFVAVVFFSVTSVAVSAATPKAAESESVATAASAQVPKSKGDKVAPSNARSTKQARSSKTNKTAKKSKKSKKPKQPKQPKAPNAGK